MSETGGLFVSLKRLLSTALGIVSTRLELLANEWEEERMRLIRMLVLALLAVFFVCMAAVLFAIFVVAAFWHDHPLLAISVLALSFFVISGLCALSLRRLLHQPPVLFSASLAELRRDRHELGAFDE
ncbi:MAG: phage holin family protein [Gammaproteobacteria bacterium]|nr:phage holin family protein [Gammaproteobacteria bacterium]MBU1625330.1 phage holin family protein [Gammaproteobacteria bacterium]MBU1981590.1 phage holin family protein [Gammaproteobacteria bacterium]